MFTPDDIAEIKGFVKSTARFDPNALVDNPYTLNNVSNYKDWFGPKSILATPKPRGRGFWSSLGQTALGAGGVAVNPVRALFGAGPGKGIFRNYAEGGLGWGMGKLLRDPQMASEGWEQLTNSRSWTDPFMRMHRQSVGGFDPATGKQMGGQLSELGNYFSREFPEHAEMVTTPHTFFRKLFQTGEPVTY